MTIKRGSGNPQGLTSSTNTYVLGELLGRATLLQVRAKVPKFVELAPLHDREITEHISHRLDDSLAAIHDAEHATIDSKTSLQVLKQRRAQGRVLRRADAQAEWHLRSIRCDSKAYDDRVPGNLETIDHQGQQLHVLEAP